MPTPDVTLLPIGGVAQLERIPEDPGQEFLIAIAGPLVNVAIALRWSIVWRRSCMTRQRHGGRERQVSLVDRLAAVNLFLALFNMIPAFPMDGGRVLRALARHAGSASCAPPKSRARSGKCVAFALGFIGLFSTRS